MKKKKKKKLQQSGLIPGTPVFVGERKVRSFRKKCLYYNQGTFSEDKLEGELLEDHILWQNMIGLHDIKSIMKECEHFGIHSLTLEDVVNTEQRPKFETYGNYFVLVLKMLSRDKENKISIEHISIVVGNNFVLTFQEVPKDPFDKIRDRIKEGSGRVRTMNASYLAYLLIDAVIDDYYVVLSAIDDTINDLDLKRKAYDENLLNLVFDTKKEITLLRKYIKPLKEAISRFIRNDLTVIDSGIKHFLVDLQDHCNEVLEALEVYKEDINSIQDTYINLTSYRMNQIMKVLTVISTIFIPLTFIAGVYGMNFHFMPELEWKYGYFLSLFIMGIISVGMVIYFKIKKWF